MNIGLNLKPLPLIKVASHMNEKFSRGNNKQQLTNKHKQQFRYSYIVFFFLESTCLDIYTLHPLHRIMPRFWKNFFTAVILCYSLSLSLSLSLSILYLFFYPLILPQLIFNTNQICMLGCKYTLKHNNCKINIWRTKKKKIKKARKKP